MPQATGALKPVETNLLAAKLTELQHSLEPGLVRLNWNNRGIEAFVAAATHAVQEFQVLHQSVAKSSTAMEKLANQIAMTQLVPDPTAASDISHTSCAPVVTGEPLELQEFYEHMESARLAAVESASARYRCLPPLLGKVCCDARLLRVLRLMLCPVAAELHVHTPRGFMVRSRCAGRGAGRWQQRWARSCAGRLLLLLGDGHLQLTCSNGGACAGAFAWAAHGCCKTSAVQGEKSCWTCPASVPVFV